MAKRAKLDKLIKTAEDLNAALDRKSEAIKKVIAALNHLPRDHALSIVLSWFSALELDAALPTLCGDEKPVTDPTEAFIHRLRIAMIQRGIDIRPYISSKNTGLFRPATELLNEAIKEALWP